MEEIGKLCEKLKWGIIGSCTLVQVLLCVTHSLGSDHQAIQTHQEEDSKLIKIIIIGFAHDTRRSYLTDTSHPKK